VSNLDVKPSFSEQSYSILQSISTLIGGAVIGLIYAYKIGLVGIGACSCFVDRDITNDGLCGYSLYARSNLDWLYSLGEVNPAWCFYGC
jgi:hypothetical protein